MDLTVFSGNPRVFDSPDVPADPDVLAALDQQVKGADLAAPPVVLPDFHHKSKMELPSSVAVATVGTVRPTLTSASVNCGMALIALDGDRPTQTAVETFYRRIKDRYPYPPTKRLELSLNEVRRAAVEGAEFAAERWGVRAEELERIEEGGRLDLERYGGATRLLKEMPSIAFQLARMRFGTVGPSNHFIELQVVEEVYDEAAAALLGLRQGQLTLQYHGGGGVLTGEVGALFGPRKYNPRNLRMAAAVQKPLFHLATARSLAEMKRRYALYFSHGCPPLDLDSDEGRRLMLANAAAMNYGFAFRVATYAYLKAVAKDVFGGAEGRLVVDSPHNSMYEEPLPTEFGEGRTAVVHRHNSCRAYPAELMPEGSVFATTGQALLLPGTNRTSSYVALPGSDVADSLHSACHGAGTVISDFERKGLSGPHPHGHKTLRYRYSDAAPAEVAHLDDNGVEAAISILTDNKLARPIVRMRPFAVLN
ncbi:RtcB family protein [Nonomuraea sp. NPDC046570]|uniref:RtcB family protein n=1 Tax=Nonomuraea sp. NPDC046570 TaxID=3155255 RepID=UPI0033F99434